MVPLKADEPPGGFCTQALYHDSRRVGDRWICAGCGWWKWIKPRDERNSWRRPVTLPDVDIRKHVLRVLTERGECYMSQLASLLDRSTGTVTVLLSAMEKDGLVKSRVEQRMDDKRWLRKWKATGAPFPVEVTPVRAGRMPEKEHVPVFSFDALVMAMERR